MRRPCPSSWPDRGRGHERVIVSASDKHGRRSGLRADDRAVWEAVTHSIKPLKRRRAETRSTSAMADEIAAMPAVNRVVPQPAKSTASVPPPLTPLARRAKQKLARGVQAIDGRLDLHGLTQGEAHLALTRFLRRAQASGARFVLVITGKGARSDAANEG